MFAIVLCLPPDAIEKVVQGGDAQIKSTGISIFLYPSQSSISAQKVGLVFLRLSREITLKPFSSKTFPTDFVPQNNSRSNILILSKIKKKKKINIFY